MTRRLISRIVSWWLSRRVDRALPELAEIKREIEARRRKHLPTRGLVSVQRSLVNARLAVEAERTVSVKGATR